MDKQRILNAISQALDACGMDMSDQDEYGESEMVEDNRVPIWSELSVDVPDSTRGPIHDRAAAFGAAKQTMQRQTDAYGMPLPGQDEEMMLATGMI